jgi:ferredoxin, 2Fe-2S
MPHLRIQNLHELTLSFEKQHTILEVLHQHRIDWMHACGAKGRCTTCKAVILEGGEHLGPLTVHEQRYADKGLLKPNERLACQCIIEQSLSVRVPDVSKLPHMDYSA